MEFYTPRQAACAVKQALSLGSDCDPLEARFELIRATIWSLATPPTSVHISRVLGTALPAWQVISERHPCSAEMLRVELKEALSMLQDAGDLVEFSGGYWAPATARFVKLYDNAGHLLVGGVPSSFLPLALGDIQYHGPYRHVAELSKELTAIVCVEDLESWAKLPNQKLSLREWAAGVIDSLQWQDYEPTTSETFEVYLPAAATSGAPQFKRWSNPSSQIDGVLLARRTRLYGAREYRLIEARVGKIARVSHLQGVDVRRLMYALDLAAGNPVRARFRSVGPYTEWLLNSELPRPEQRVFAALGTLTVPTDYRRFERRWTIKRNQDLADQMLRGLGVQRISAS